MLRLVPQGLEPARQSGGELSIDKETQLRAPEHRMIMLACCELKNRDDVLGLQVRQVLQDFLSRRPRRKEFQHVCDTDAQAADARSSSTHGHVCCDPIHLARHQLLQTTARWLAATATRREVRQVWFRALRAGGRQQVNPAGLRRRPVMPNNIRWDTFDAIMQTGFLADTIATDGSTTSHAREQPRHPEPADPCGRPDRAMAYPGGRPHADGSPHPLGRRLAVKRATGAGRWSSVP
jgi:hypothetical protein